MSLSDSCAEENSSQRSGSAADYPISIASSPASSVSSCDTVSIQGTEELEVNTGMDPQSSDTTSNDSTWHVVGDTTAIPSADNGARIQALMAKYEQVMSGTAAQTQCVSSDVLASQGDDGAISHDSHVHDDRSVDKLKTGAPHGNPKSRRTRRGKNQPSKVQSRVQKKRASASNNQAYTFLRLGEARRAASGAVECEVYWAPTWLPLDQLEGDDAVQEAKDLVVDLFGSDTWHKEAQKLGLLL